MLIACKLPNGVRLRLTDVHPADPEMRIAVGEPVILKGPPGGAAAGSVAFTEVAEDFWHAWLEQNAQNPLVTSGAVCVADVADFDSKVAFTAGA